MPQGKFKPKDLWAKEDIMISNLRIMLFGLLLILPNVVFAQNIAKNFTFDPMTAADQANGYAVYLYEVDSYVVETRKYAVAFNSDYPMYSKHRYRITEEKELSRYGTERLPDFVKFLGVEKPLVVILVKGGYGSIVYQGYRYGSIDSKLAYNDTDDDCMVGCLADYFKAVATPAGFISP